MKIRAPARSTSRQSRSQSSCARGPANSRTWRGSRSSSAAASSSASIWEALSMWTGAGRLSRRRRRLPSAGFSLSPNRLYSIATESAHCRKSIVLLSDPAKGAADLTVGVSLRLATLDCPRAGLRLLHLERPIFVDRLGVDLAERPIAEEGQHVPERPLLVGARLLGDLALALGDEVGRRNRRRAAPHRSRPPRHRGACASSAAPIDPGARRRGRSAALHRPSPNSSRRARSRASRTDARRRRGSEARSRSHSSTRAL